MSELQIDHMEKLLKRARLATRTNRKSYFVSQCLGSFDVALHATLEAYDAMRPHHRPNKSKLKEIASSLDPWKGTNEPVRVYWKPKKSNPNKRRVVCAFEIESRALQYLVRNVLSGLLELHPDQYLLRGGVQEAIKQTSKALGDGFLWAVEIDISDCYPSFDGTKLSQLLPLPKEVTENVLLSDHLNIVPSNYWHDIGLKCDHQGDSFTLEAALSAARQGIPQGSAASPLIAEAMIAIALKQVPNLGATIAYADNVLLLAKSECELASMTKALGAALKAHPVGRLKPTKTVFKPSQPIEFLGHVLSLSNGVVRIEPSESNIRGFEERVSSDLAYIRKATLGPSKRRTYYRALKDYIQDWTASFSLCDNIEGIRSYWLGQAKEAREPGNVVYKTFKLHPDQKEIVDAALKYTKKRSGTAYDTVALEYICQEVMGTGLAFPTLRAALVAQRNKSGSGEEFLATLLPIIEELVPGVNPETEPK